MTTTDDTTTGPTDPPRIGELGDPHLEARQAAAAHLDAWEERIHAAARKALHQWTNLVTSAVLDGQHLTAAPGDTLPPDPGTIPPLTGAWTSLANAHIVSEVSQLLGEVFADVLTDEQVTSVRPWQEEYLATVTNRLVRVADTTFDMVRGEVQEGIDAGESIPKIRDRVQTVLDDQGEASWEHRARTIARTETIGAYNGGDLEAHRALAEATGESLDKAWLCTIDTRTRDSHFAADGQRRPLTEPFHVGAAELMHPGDPTGPAGEVINCRCVQLWVDATEVTPDTEDRQLRPATEVQSEIDRRAEGEDPVVRAYNDPDEQDAQAQAIREAREAQAAADVAARTQAANTPTPETTLATDPAPGAVPGDLTHSVDDYGIPWALSYDYLSQLDDAQLDELTDNLAARLDDANPLQGQRWADLDAYLEAQATTEDLAAEEESVGLAETDRLIQAWLAANGRPGLTHPDLAGTEFAAATPTLRQVQVEWSAYLGEVYVRAQNATSGALLNRKGEAKGISPTELLSGRVRDVMSYASEELLEFFETEGRLSWAEFYYRRTGAPAWAGKAAAQAELNSRITRDRSAFRSSLKADAGTPTDADPTTDQRNAYTAGRTAYTTGAGLDTCPHTDPGDPDGLLTLWVRGYVLARRDAITADLAARGLLPDTAPAPELTIPPSGDTVTAAGSGPGDPSPSEGRRPMPRTWASDPHLAPFDTPTGDGRIFAVGSLTARDLPLPLLFQPSSSMGHDGSEVVGRILTVEFTDTGIVATGDYLDVDADTNPDLHAVIERAVALAEQGLGHVSVDLSDVIAGMVDEDGNEVTMEDIWDAWEDGEEPVVLQQVTEGKLIAVTQVATPAFEGAKIKPTAEADQATVDAQAALAGALATALEDSTGAAIGVGDVVDVTTESDGTVRGEVTAVDEAAETVTVQPTDDAGAATGDPLVVTPDAVTVVTKADAETPDTEDKAPASGDAALVASASHLLHPPAEWFADPKLTAPTALTITDDGQVYGHAATWDTCHVGYANTCMTPPPSPSGYAYFHTGQVVTDDGTRVAVGNLTLGGRHADVRLAFRSAIEHYDVQGAGVAVVRMYEDEHGIAFAGALTPGVSEEQLYDMRRSPVSGDWRKVAGDLDLIGVLSVNAPGFPTPRFAADATGRTALVAAPSVRPDVESALVASGRKRRGMSQAELTRRIADDVERRITARLEREAAQARAKARLQATATRLHRDPASRVAALANRIGAQR